jgi:hypothetical protein
VSYSEVHEIQISKDGENWITVDSYCRFSRAFEEVTKMLVNQKESIRIFKRVRHEESLVLFSME